MLMSTLDIGVNLDADNDIDPDVDLDLGLDLHLETAVYLHISPTDSSSALLHFYHQSMPLYSHHPVHLNHHYDTNLGRQIGKPRYIIICRKKEDLIRMFIQLAPRCDVM